MYAEFFIDKLENCLNVINTQILATLCVSIECLDLRSTPYLKDGSFTMVKANMLSLSLYDRSCVCISDIVTNIPKVARRLASLQCPISPISVLINLLIISAGQDASGVSQEMVHQAPEELRINWAVSLWASLNISTSKLTRSEFQKHVSPS